MRRRSPPLIRRLEIHVQRRDYLASISLKPDAQEGASTLVCPKGPPGRKGRVDLSRPSCWNVVRLQWTVFRKRKGMHGCCCCSIGLMQDIE